MKHETSPVYHFIPSEMCDVCLWYPRLGEFVYMNNISRSLTHDYPDPRSDRNTQPTTVHIRSWPTFWSQPWPHSLLHPNKYRSKLPVIGGQLRWRYPNIRRSPGMEYLIISLVMSGWLGGRQWPVHQVSDCAV